MVKPVPYLVFLQSMMNGEEVIKFIKSMNLNPHISLTLLIKLILKLTFMKTSLCKFSYILLVTI